MARHHLVYDLTAGIVTGSSYELGPNSSTPTPQVIDRRLSEVELVTIAEAFKDLCVEAAPAQSAQAQAPGGYSILRLFYSARDYRELVLVQGSPEMPAMAPVAAGMPLAFVPRETFAALVAVLLER